MQEREAVDGNSATSNVMAVGWDIVNVESTLDAAPTQTDQVDTKINLVASARVYFSMCADGRSRVQGTAVVFWSQSYKGFWV